MATSRNRRITTMTSRQFNQQTSRAKQAADHGPVVVTDRGEPAYVLMSYGEYSRLDKPAPPLSAAEALADPNFDPSEPDFAQFLPQREIEPRGNLFDRDE
jgi:PHD/YefM family antitoxin component YafN of YafNO toxin-antitoxin module